MREMSVNKRLDERTPGTTRWFRVRLNRKLAKKVLVILRTNAKGDQACRAGLRSAAALIKRFVRSTSIVRTDEEVSENFLQTYTAFCEEDPATSLGISFDEDFRITALQGWAAAAVTGDGGRIEVGDVLLGLNNEFFADVRGDQPPTTLDEVVGLIQDAGRPLSLLLGRRRCRRQLESGRCERIQWLKPLCLQCPPAWRSPGFGPSARDCSPPARSPLLWIYPSFRRSEESDSFAVPQYHGQRPAMDMRTRG